MCHIAEFDTFVRVASGTIPMNIYDSENTLRRRYLTSLKGHGSYVKNVYIRLNDRDTREKHVNVGE